MAASPLSHQLLEPDAALEYTAAAREFVSAEPGEGEHPARGIKTFPLPHAPPGHSLGREQSQI